MLVGEGGYSNIHMIHKQLCEAKQEIDRLRKDLSLHQELLSTEQAENEELRGRLNKVALDWQIKENEVTALRGEIKEYKESNSRLEFFIGGLNKGIEENKARAEAAEKTERERCIKIIRAEEQRVLAKQTLKAAPGSFAYAVNTQTRMMVVLFGNLIDEIEGKEHL